MTRDANGHAAAPACFAAWRRALLLGALIVPGLAIGARLAMLQVVHHERLAQRAENQARHVVEIPGPRGDIVDRHGRLLAVSVPTKVVIVEPRKIPRASLRLIERAVGAKRGRLTGRADDPWEIATRACGPACERSMRALIAEGRVPERAVHWQPGFGREYPHGTRAAHVLGFVTHDGAVKEGIERGHDHVLGSSGSRLLLVRDAHQNTVASTAHGARATEPSSLMLTIDLRLQALLEDELANAVRSHGALAAQGIVLDPKTGEVLAMAGVPAFDPNRFSRAAARLHRNPVVEHFYEPGSVLKPLTAAALLDAGLAAPTDAVDCENGSWRVGARPIRDHHPHGILSLAQVIEVSSNIGIAKFSRRLSPGRLHGALRRFGLGAKTGVDVPAESPGSLRPARDWRGVDHESVAFGHAVAVTVLQLGAAYGALANDGVWVQPRVARAWGSPDGTWHQTPGSPSHRAVAPETARTVTAMLRRVVEGRRGTGRSALVPGFAVAGKTGTAEKVIDGRYDRTRNVTSFAGFAPADDPAAVVVVVIDEPRVGGRTAAATAAPVFSRVMAETLRLARVPASRPSLGGPHRVAAVRDRARAAR